MKLTRYWIELKGKAAPANQFGVTAYTVDDALGLITEYFERTYQEEGPVEALRIVENVDVSTLDEGHVLPNMLPPTYRGVWYPMS
ncbi:hypothetical protein [Hymenobacter jeollabukensis]|uniref:Uncharacterized protein n=1 Tax=Hymenobacter jeollabukensis TaxID=2025313 RepID=A0A5R8WM67_9BACT|nr:hypothetical protein [Hymenobacter jeollabukensis]TLM90457.1 hypothetical protein FDY95_17230 [Hymenobacter jeollabukensis]